MVIKYIIKFYSSKLSLDTVSHFFNRKLLLNPRRFRVVMPIL